MSREETAEHRTACPVDNSRRQRLWQKTTT